MLRPNSSWRKPPTLDSLSSPPALRPSSGTEHAPGLAIQASRPAALGLTPASSAARRPRTLAQLRAQSKTAATLPKQPVMVPQKKRSPVAAAPISSGGAAAASVPKRRAKASYTSNDQNAKQNAPTILGNVSSFCSGTFKLKIGLLDPPRLVIRDMVAMVCDLTDQSTAALNVQSQARSIQYAAPN